MVGTPESDRIHLYYRALSGATAPLVVDIRGEDFIIIRDLSVGKDFAD